MSLTRRDCLRIGLGSSAVLACGHVAPAFLANSAQALAAAENATAGRILVVIELDGGNDGLNTIVPYTDDIYYRNRPHLKIAANSVLKIDDRIGFHPQLRGFADLLEQKQLAVVQSVGYPLISGSRSHFEGMAVWQSGRLDGTLQSEGWLARYLDIQAPQGSLNTHAIHIDDGKLAQSLAGGNYSVPSLNRLEQLERRLGVPLDANPAEQRSRLDTLLGQSRGDPGSPLQFLQQSAVISFASSHRLRELIRAAKTSSEPYPAFELAGRLKLMAQLIKAKLNTTVYYTRLGGFDTHAEQQYKHARLMSELGSSLAAFFNDLKQSGEADRVLVMAYSEFGRRLEENAAFGTDHGTAGPVFLAGPAGRPGVHGPYPSLLDLDEGDPKYGIDFRQVYSTILERWLNCPAAAVLSESFERLPILNVS
jgi:uncharacterized protein (DUF1501 family)